MHKKQILPHLLAYLHKLGLEQNMHKFKTPTKKQIEEETEKGSEHSRRCSYAQTSSKRRGRSPYTSQYKGGKG